MINIEHFLNHARAYPDPNPATGTAWTTAERVDDLNRISNELAALVPSDDQAVITASVDLSIAVDAAMAALKVSDPSEFAKAKKETFDQLVARFGL